VGGIDSAQYREGRVKECLGGGLWYKCVRGGRKVGVVRGGNCQNDTLAIHM